MNKERELATKIYEALVKEGAELGNASILIIEEVLAESPSPLSEIKPFDSAGELPMDLRKEKTPIPERIYDNMRKDRIGRPLCNYLEKMYSEGITEFRVAMQNGKWFVIHPMDKNGETKDIKWDGEGEKVLAIW